MDTSPTPTKAPTVHQLYTLARRLGVIYSDVWWNDRSELQLVLIVEGKAPADARRKLGVILDGALRALSEEEKQS